MYETENERKERIRSLYSRITKKEVKDMITVIEKTVENYDFKLDGFFYEPNVKDEFEYLLIGIRKEKKK